MPFLCLCVFGLAPWCRMRPHTPSSLLGSQWGMNGVIPTEIRSPELFPGHGENRIRPARSQGNTTKRNNAQHNQNQPPTPRSHRFKASRSTHEYRESNCSLTRFAGFCLTAYKTIVYCNFCFRIFHKTYRFLCNHNRQNIIC